jgi:hypothetical protein
MRAIDPAHFRRAMSHRLITDAMLALETHAEDPLIYSDRSYGGLPEACSA